MNTNLLVASNETYVGKIEGRKTKLVNTYLNLPKKGSYEIQVIVFEDGKGIKSGERKIYGLERLEPPSVAKISLRALDFLVESVESGKEEHVKINTTLYINLGDDVSGLSALIKARDNETKLILDKKWIDLGFLRSGTTSIHHATLSVPNSYIFEVQIWQSDRIIKEGSGIVILSPFGNRTEVIGAEEKIVEISPEIEISDFAPKSPTPVPMPTPATAPLTPGFSLIFGVIALIAALFFMGRSEIRERRG